MNATGIVGDGSLHAAGRALSADGTGSSYGTDADVSLGACAGDGLVPAPGARPPICDDEPPSGSDDDCVTAARRSGSGLCQWLQAFEDAIKFRHTRASAPCGDCDTVPDRCDDHGRDLGLVTAYQHTARQLLQAPPYPLSSDTRVTAARDLLAEHHQPAAMPAGDLRALLARYQKRLHWLLDALGTADPETGS